MHTHPHLHTHTHIRPATMDHGNTNLEIFCQGLRAGVALALGPSSSRTQGMEAGEGWLPWMDLP